MIHVRVPATSANCCVGFDCMGLALNWYGHFSFEKADQLEIDGCPEAFCNEENLVVQAFYKVCSYLGVDKIPFRLHIDSDIPFARGLGSSSCCVVAGLLGANALLNGHLSQEELLDLAVEMEGHPDNIAPAILGSLTIADHRNVLRVELEDWHGLVFIPDYEISTPMARALLPEELPFAQAVRQTSHALLFLTAMERGTQPLAAMSCHDYLHEPYRARLIKEYEPIQKLCKERDMPFWISGSGSCMIAMSLKAVQLEELKQAVNRMYPDLASRFVEISQKGAEIYYE